jgi:hypothetical protein
MKYYVNTSYLPEWMKEEDISLLLIPKNGLGFPLLHIRPIIFLCDDLMMTLNSQHSEKKHI